MATWIAAFNHPTKSWSTGGAASEYARPHWDLYEVKASDRDRAQTLARGLRAKQRNLPAKQALLLASLLKEADSLAIQGEAESWMEVTVNEAAASASLVAKGLLLAKDESCRHVKLTICSRNQLGLPAL
ncbi:hypothetical protein [Paucibacter soli]|uniref:hypothetical protein n=1 Tax=Paucibacter soli TaxID=3133433 RepID=UPI00309FF7BD